MSSSQTIATRPFGHAGLEVTEIGLGCNNFGRRLDLAGTRAVIDACLEQGVTFLDTADIYGGAGASETLMGEALEGRRDQFVLATKFGMDMGDGAQARGSAEYIAKAIDASLRRLRTDYVDVLWYHQPDGVTPIAETLTALHRLVQAGKVRALGASNFTAAQLEEADRVARENDLTPFSGLQNELSLLKREAERDVLPACERLGIAFVPYFPLASGLLTGKYRRGENGPQGARLSGREEIASAEDWRRVKGIGRFAEQRGVAMSDVAIGALLAKPAVCSVIAGATKPEQVAANAAAAGWKPSQDDLAELERILA